MTNAELERIAAVAVAVYERQAGEWVEDDDEYGFREASPGFGNPGSSVRRELARDLIRDLRDAGFDIVRREGGS